MSSSRADPASIARPPRRAGAAGGSAILVVAMLILGVACRSGSSGSTGEQPHGPSSPSAPWEGPAVTALTAEAGPDRAVGAGARVTLDGTRSRSPAGAITSWSWVQSDGPAVTLSGAGTARPSFDAPEVDGAGGRLSFQLTVGDATSATAVDVIHVDLQERGAPVPTTSLGKLRRAMQEGSVDRETAARYLAFATWDDPRLPAEFRGEPSRSASWAHAVLAEEFATLSSETQAIVLPFLLPPGHPEGHAPGALAASGRAAAALPPAERHSVEGAHVVVWYRSTLADGALTASALVTEIEGTIWLRLHEVWTDDHMPVLDDSRVGAAFNGIHGKLNVYLEPLADYGYMSPYGKGPAPTFVVLRESLPFSGRSPAGLVESAAHELTHSCQYSFRHKEPYGARRFLYEAVATWAEDDVYPDHHSEQEYAGTFLDHMTLPLDDDTTDLRPYGSYLLFQWVTRGSEDRAFVRRAFVEAENTTQLQAVDAAFPRWGGLYFGFEKLWGSFVDQIWNRNPGESFWELDDLTSGAQAVGPPLELTVGATGDAGFELNAGVRHLTARIHRFTLGDPNVRTIHFYDGLSYRLMELTGDDGSVALVPDPAGTPFDNQGAVTRMFLKRGERWTALGWNSPSLGDRSICQDTPAEEVQEIAIAFGDAIPEQGHALRPLGEPPLLWVTNIGCDHWEGTVSAQTSAGRADLPQETVTATNVLFTRFHPAGMDTGELAFQLEAADVSWSIGGAVGNCTYSGTQSWHQGSPNGPTGGLGFVPTILSGGSHRKYEASATGTEHPVSYTITCTFPDSPPVVTTGTKVVEWLRTVKAADPAWRPTVSDDGQLAAGTADAGDMTYTWTLKAFPGLAPLEN
jgi:hypothetical protein